MTNTIDYDRHLRLWGVEGQNLLKDARIAIVGAHNLGIETAKTASVLGIGNIYLIDTRESYGKDTLLDISIPRGNTSKGIARIVSSTLNPDCHIEGISARISDGLLGLIGPLDAIIDTTNDPRSQYIGYYRARTENAHFFSAVCDAVQGVVSMYSPLVQDGGFAIVLPGFEGSGQGRIMSGIISSVLLEELRKCIFLSDSERFKQVRISRRDGALRAPDGSLLNYYDAVLRYEHPLRGDFRFSLNRNCGDSKKSADYERSLRGKRALALGIGAIGTEICDLLPRLGFERVDVVDVGRFESTNLSRQLLGYAGVGKPKAEVVSEKVNRIAGRDISRPIIGYVGEALDEGKVRKENMLKSKVTLLDKAWFARNSGNYDIVFGCFDSNSARLAATACASEGRFPYLDAGSGGSITNQSRVSVYVPGRTNCMRHMPLSPVTEGSEIAAAKRRAADEEKRTRLMQDNRADYEEVVSVRGGASCSAEWIEGSIIMSNKIAASLLLGEVPRIFDDSLGGLVDSLFYSGQKGSSITLHDKKDKCSCGVP